MTSGLVAEQLGVNARYGQEVDVYTAAWIGALMHPEEPSRVPIVSQELRERGFEPIDIVLASTFGLKAARELISQE